MLGKHTAAAGSPALSCSPLSACRHLACNNGACTLCKHNPAKRCTVNFARHYHVDERLLAKCDGDIQVELLEAGTGERFQEPLVGCRAEVRICREGAVPASTRSRSGCLGAVPVLTRSGVAVSVRCLCQQGPGVPVWVRCLCQQGPGVAVWVQFTADHMQRGLAKCNRGIQGAAPCIGGRVQGTLGRMQGRAGFKVGIAGCVQKGGASSQLPSTVQYTACDCASQKGAQGSMMKVAMGEEGPRIPSPLAFASQLRVLERVAQRQPDRLQGRGGTQRQLEEGGRFIAASSVCRLHAQQTQMQHCAQPSSLCETAGMSQLGVMCSVAGAHLPARAVLPCGAS